MAKQRKANSESDERHQKLHEMVRARTKIQNELIELLGFKQAHEEYFQASKYLRILGLLGSIGFSLWRAAFLFGYEEGQHDSYISNVETFVTKIITDNAITFSDDKNVWSLWHYIGVARSSLLEAMTLLEAQLNSPRFHTLKAKLVDAPLLSATAAQQWDELFEIMQWVRETTSARFEQVKSMRPLLSS